MNWQMARRAEKMNPSVIRAILKVNKLPGIISFPVGLPLPQTFPTHAVRTASVCSKMTEKPTSKTPPALVTPRCSNGLRKTCSSKCVDKGCGLCVGLGHLCASSRRKHAAPVVGNATVDQINTDMEALAAAVRESL
jgi:hypothetical protein